MLERGLQYPVLRVKRGPAMIALVPGEVVARCIYVLGSCSTGACGLLAGGLSA
jgi:hypothetical protein